METQKKGSQKVEAVVEAKKENRQFIFTTFGVGQAIAILLVILYWMTSKSTEKLFHIIVIYGAAGITIPMFVCTMKLMLKGYYLSLDGWHSTNRMVDGYDSLQNQFKPIVENVEKVVDKAVPISESVAEVVSRARGMAADIETIAHRVRGMMESMNGALDLKVIEGHMKEVKEHLATLASAFTFKKRQGAQSAEGEEAAGDFPFEFDPLKGGTRKERRR